jgi:hypothetical protein
MCFRRSLTSLSAHIDLDLVVNLTSTMVPMPALLSLPRSQLTAITTLLRIESKSSLPPKDTCLLYSLRQATSARQGASTRRTQRQTQSIHQVIFQGNYQSVR